MIEELKQNDDDLSETANTSKRQIIDAIDEVDMKK